jgi:hypothetical protein
VIDLLEDEARHQQTFNHARRLKRCEPSTSRTATLDGRNENRRSLRVFNAKQQLNENITSQRAAVEELATIIPARATSINKTITTVSHQN